MRVALLPLLALSITLGCGGDPATDAGVRPRDAARDIADADADADADTDSGAPTLCPPDDPCASGCTRAELFVEAESFYGSDDWRVTDAPDARLGRSVTPRGNELHYYPFTVATPGPQQLCARMRNAAGRAAEVRVEVEGFRARLTGTDASAWTWSCVDVHVPLRDVWLGVRYWAGGTELDAFALLPPGEPPPTGEGEAAPDACGNDTCQQGESCESCPECCEARCGDGRCTRPDEDRGTCPDDCRGGDACTPYDGVCRDGADLAALPAGHWCAVRQNARTAEKRPAEYDDFDGSTSASFESYQRVQGFDALISAWNGGAFDRRRDRLVLFGGGHDDYGGNELVAFSLTTLRWERLSDPTPFPNRRPDWQNPDGTPISRHSYDGVTYLTETDEVFAFGGAPDAAEGGCNTPGAWRFDLGARESSGTYSPDQWRLATRDGEPRTECENRAVEDPERGRVLFATQAGWFAYDVASDAWSMLRATTRNQGAQAVVIPGRGEMLQFGGRLEGVVRRFDLTDPDFTFEEITPPSSPVATASNVGAAWDSALGAVVVWSGGAEVHVLDPDTLSWTTRAPPATNAASPGPVTSRGVYGRWRYSERLDVHVVVDDADRPVFLLRVGG
ncbi:MAG: hypothetical protein SangKO_076920 [Sandaracinaceae bacterium]